MIVKFWGVRGSIPTPPTQPVILEKLKTALARALRQKIQLEEIDQFIEDLPDSVKTVVGGNTPCLEIVSGQDRVIIDAGTGINGLGQTLCPDEFPSDSDRLRYLVEKPQTPIKVAPYREPEHFLHLNILLTHTHWDHIQGFPFFAPIYRCGNVIDVYGLDGERIRENLHGQQRCSTLFPVSLNEVAAVINFRTFPKEGLQIGSIAVTAISLPHPGGCLAFKLKADDKVLVFATDYEFIADDEDDDDKDRQALAEFVQDADVFISDTQYTFIESMTKEGWGHSSPLRVAEMALHAGVKKFFLFHHDPFYSDAKLFDMLVRTRTYAKLLSNKRDMEIHLAIEGQTVEI
ncbi:MAG: MBL fold metallo-hydrolase [Deltaproteobacteria bacterium]|jgi:phosphoribosyl 1,2-cyclic phosphodiesterase|nr:MBL fold metallo-hydrolase [Deltaproteobacteria bacterium]